MRNLRLAIDAGNDLAQQMMEDVLADYIQPNASYSGAARAVGRDPDAFVTVPPD